MLYEYDRSTMAHFDGNTAQDFFFLTPALFFFRVTLTLVEAFRVH